MKTPVMKVTSDVRKSILVLLNHLGVPSNKLGYEYLKEAIEVSLEDPDSIHSITKSLYPAVAKRVGSTPPRVERAIRYAIETSFERCSAEELFDRFGACVSPVSGKLTNGEFIALAAEKIRMEAGAYDN